MSADEEVIEAEYEAPVYPDNQPVEEQRRAYVLAQLANAEIDGRILLETCGLFEKWLASGDVPEKRPGKPKLVTT